MIGIQSPMFIIMVPTFPLCVLTFELINKIVTIKSQILAIKSKYVCCRQVLSTKRVRSLQLLLCITSIDLSLWCKLKPDGSRHCLWVHWWSVSQELLFLPSWRSITMPNEIPPVTITREARTCPTMRMEGGKSPMPKPSALNLPTLCNNPLPLLLTHDSTVDEV